MVIGGLFQRDGSTVVVSFIVGDIYFVYKHKLFCLCHSFHFLQFMCFRVYISAIWNISSSS